MAQFLPFHGLRYAVDGDPLAQLICPPYDVIKGAARDELLARDEHNIVGVELAARYGEPVSPEQYAQSALLLKEWVAQGVLVRDDAAYYVYEQEFAVPGRPGEKLRRRGVLGALTLEEFGKGVQPHEFTLSGPKQDRLHLLRATRTNTSPIFGLFDDSEGWVEKVVATVVKDRPVAHATDAEGVTHRLWKLTDDESVNAIEAAFEKESILIADGHHRYETALTYSKERSQQHADAGGTGCETQGEHAVMMMCVAMQDEGLIVLPTHRVVKNVDNALLAALPQKLAAWFEVEPVNGGAAAVTTALSHEAVKNRLGLLLKGSAWLLTLKPGTGHMAQLEAGKSEAYNGLDVTVLHRLILENELGIGPAELAAGSHVVYTIDALEAERKVEAGEAGAAFLLQPTPVEQVQAVAAAGEKMPQKSTYFYPKLVTGLVLRPLD